MRKKYSTIEREALEIVYVLKKFNQYHYGRHFMIRTDHKPLEHLFSTKRHFPSIAISRLERWVLTLNICDFDIIYRSGASYAIADTLSRLPSSDPETQDDKEKRCENKKC
ncbi:Retrovirus-related Pol polyprotein from transposon 17.6 [Thelohanellus kitauei]|uniref:Retrovirus-related Pol polyprotein from transposon 17.6 n=1 Tax=Thelohanellus kitauei TaxID=669202 RepID=A0A0C2MEH8_THEKT|nr:Retrovirus-related Pol polyprotein from transposon 17.6 [Thelohanellus kitauei]